MSGSPESMGELPIKNAFRIGERDNVATCLDEVGSGQRVRILGEMLPAGAGELESAERIEPGHKIAVQEIRQGEPIIKFNTPIGRATADIARGKWVHLHNMESSYDERSATLDRRTGAATDTLYE